MIGTGVGPKPNAFVVFSVVGFFSILTISLGLISLALGSFLTAAEQTV